MVARIRGLGARKLSYAGRITLINSVLNTLYNYWATMFLLPKCVIKRIEAICRNFLWAGSSEYQRVPLVAWDKVTLSKDEGGLGIIKADLWNTATVGKLVEWVYTKADKLWIRWINHIYLKNNSWQEYVPPADASWSWKNVCKVKEVFKDGYINAKWNDQKQGYSIRSGYEWLRKDIPIRNWSEVVWNKWTIPKHSIVSWLVMQGGLNVKAKLVRFGCCDDALCCLCNCGTETSEHVFRDCAYSSNVRYAVESWLGNAIPTVQMQADVNCRSIRWSIVAAILNALNYNLWTQRNNARVNQMLLRPKLVAKQIEEEVKCRIRQQQTQNMDQATLNWFKQLGV